MYPFGMAMNELGERARTVPLYTIAEAASIVGLPPNTLRNWTHGYAYSTTWKGQQESGPLVTSHGQGHGLSIPFNGLAEAFVITRLREAGVPMRRIRPAVEKLRDEFGIEYALLSDRLKTNGATVLFEYVVDVDHDHPAATSLAEVTTKQMAFEGKMAESLRVVSYRGHYARSFRLPQFEVPVVVDPEVNAGRPTLAEYWVRLEDVRSRVAAGEQVDSVADDYGIPLDAARELVDA